MSQGVASDGFTQTIRAALGVDNAEYGNLRLSPKAVSIALVITGLLLLPLADRAPQRLPVLLFALVLDTLAVGIWLATDWRSNVGRWCAVGSVTLLIPVAATWFAASGLLVLGPLPALLAMAAIGFPAAVVVGLSEAVLWMSISRSPLASFPSLDLSLAIVAQGVTLGLLYTIYQPTYHITTWSWKHFQRAQMLLEEARNRQMELAQALDDLAHANRQLTLLNEKLAGLRLMAEEAQNAKAIFVAKVSHEFRTPLNIIISLIDLLMETPEVYGDELPALLLEDLSIVHRNCEHLSHMINDVLDLSQTETGQLALHRDWVSLRATIESAAEVVQALVKKKKLTLSLRIEAHLPAVYCDPNRTRQIILNLVSNAARFTDKGGITLTAKREERHIVISIADTGAGIAPETAKRIFEPFYQGDAQAQSTQGGYGLGLSISKRFVELQGGKMWFTSTVGTGSTFYFTLPIAPPQAPLARPGHWISEEWAWRTRPTKLLATDYPTKTRLVICDQGAELSALLAHHSDTIELIDVRSLAQATEELAQCPAHALLINAPPLQNLALLMEQARANAPDTPVMICSFQSQMQRLADAGATDYLIKPVMSAHLQAAIQAIGRPVARVLVVDDDPDFQRLLPRMLSTYAAVATVTVVGTGAQALRQLQDDPPDLMLLDIVLPDMSGWQILEAKNRHASLRDIPVIILSAQDPADQPATSPIFLATIGQGFSISKFLHCSLEVAAFLTKPEPTPAPGLE
jgi:signal transduction histidine kinase/CheY-like chemotaxis protein